MFCEKMISLENASKYFDSFCVLSVVSVALGIWKFDYDPLH